MKEQEPSGVKEPIKLTTQPHPNRLEGRGIFMPDGTSGAGREGPPPGGEPPQGVSPERIAAAKRAWEAANEGRTDLTADERQTQEMMARMGIAPVSAGDGERARREDRKYDYFSNDEGDAILGDDVERERVFEEIFVGIDAKPGEQFQLSLNASSKLDVFYTLLNSAKVYDGQHREITAPAEVAKRRQQLNQEFSGREAIRRVLHNANWSVSEGGGEIKEFASLVATFKSEHVDLIFQDPLVTTALHMFEQAFQQIKAENGGQLPYEQLAWNPKTKSSGLEDRVWGLMREAMRLGVDEGVPEWRLRRSIILARGFGVVSLRFPEIAAQARLPEESVFASSTETSSRLGSIYGEAIARYLDPLEHIIEKFAIGKDDRAFLYYFLTGDKKHLESSDQLEKALLMASDLSGEDKRLIDIVNLFRIGGPFSQSSWRSFMAMRGVSPEERRRFGIGILEARLSGDIDDQIRNKVLRELASARTGKPEAELTAQELEEVERSLTAKEKEALRRRFKKETSSSSEEKQRMMNDERLKMWQDALKANPLRVMWQWEEKNPGQRVRFLAEALSIPESEAKELLPKIEQDLMIIQENTVQSLARGTKTYNDVEMLDFDLISDKTQRDRIKDYVAKIRQKATANNYEFIRSMCSTGLAESKKTKFPFVIGFEDIPFSDLDFINTGGRGFARRINDYAASVNATNELIGLIAEIPTTHDIKPLIEALNKIKQNVAQYDKDIAMEVVPYLARGIIKMYDKDLLAKLPLGIGTVVGMVKETSFAQTQYGRKAMTWDETDKFNFTTQLFNNGLISKKELDKLREDVGATKLDTAIDMFRTYGQLVLLMLLYSFAKEVGKEK